LQVQAYHPEALLLSVAVSQSIALPDAFYCQWH